MKREKSIVSLGGALLLLAILATYANHFHNGFHFDDWHTIVNNVSIHELRNIPLFFRDATTFSAEPSTRSYRPLVSTLLAIDYRLAHGLNPFWFHLSIFALFIALTLLVAFVIHHLLECEAASSRNRWIALAAAAWYALDPANADTINYIIASLGRDVRTRHDRVVCRVLRFPATPPISSLHSPGRDRHTGKTNGCDLCRALRCVLFALPRPRNRRAQTSRARTGRWMWPCRLSSAQCCYCSSST